MSTELIVGLLTLAIPLFGAGYLMLRRNAGVFRMFTAMLIIGLGYLGLTGALDDIGRKVLGTANVTPATVPATDVAPVAPQPAPTPPPESAPADNAATQPSGAMPATESPAPTPESPASPPSGGAPAPATP